VLVPGDSCRSCRGEMGESGNAFGTVSGVFFFRRKRNDLNASWVETPASPPRICSGFFHGVLGVTRHSLQASANRLFEEKKANVYMILDGKCILMVSSNVCDRQLWNTGGIVNFRERCSIGGSCCRTRVYGRYLSGASTSLVIK
jgi:hypothetical protein